MVTEITITVKPEEEKNQALIKKLVLRELNKSNKAFKEVDINKEAFHLVFIKKSIDARHGQLKFHLRYKVYIGEEPQAAQHSVPEWKKAEGKKTVIVVGSGPAGLFGALKLLEYGIKPVIIERGCDTQQRRKDIALISTKDKVNSDSNYCFGEGGAGTFSDGKLYTRSNKRGDISEVLSIFHHFGADQKILTDAHPHIGTDKLPKIINAMRDKIIDLGGQVCFNTRVVDFILSSNNKNDTHNDNKGDLALKITGVKTINTITNATEDFYADAVLLATGHSAPDIYELIAKVAPQALEAKTFAAGVRVEHPRELIDAIQYRGRKIQNLGAAEYRVTTQVQERGVYSFCMCPGGFVVPSSSGPDEIVVNGMSAAARNSKWSNAALVVEIRPEDIPSEYVEQAKKAGTKELAGLYFRTAIEHQAKLNGNGQAAPAQMMKDFLDNKKSSELIPTSYTPGIVSSNMNLWLPEHICSRLKQGFKQINQDMHGFISDKALMIAVETRTSTPVRILRQKDTFESMQIKGLYPVGEGAGYSGGIVSSAMDGINACSYMAKII